MSPEELTAELRQMVGTPADEVDHERLLAISHALDESARDLSAVEADGVQRALGAVVEHLTGLRTEVRTQLGQIASKGRAARGYGRQPGEDRFMRGQRVNRGV